jgi:hypothetical protein
MPATTTWGTGPSVRDADEKRRDFRLMCFAASLAPLVLLATPWLTTGNDASSPVFPGGIEHVDWSGAPSVAVGIWLVAVCVSVAGWSTRPDPTARNAG